MKKFTFWLLLTTAFTVLTCSAFAATPLSLNSGWNLMSSRTSITVADTLKTSQIASVWCWDSTAKAWKVSLPNNTDGGQEYAASKTFTLLETIAPNDGFWVNVIAPDATFPISLAIPGDETSASTLTLQPGWNLTGVPSATSITVASTFSDTNSFFSVWKWTGDKWAVYLAGEETPGTYATAKGFTQLTTLLPGEGFWVNVKAASQLTADLVAQPPLVGKISEVVDKTDKNSYKPLAGADVWVDNVSVGKTDSLGAFQATNYGANVTIAVKQTGYVDLSETFSVPDSKQLYLFVQKQDPTTATLTATEGLNKPAPGKPTPKIIASSDGTTSLQVVNMKLTKDITVAVTPYSSYNTAPSASGFADAGLTAPEVLGGGVISMTDANGDATNNSAAGFNASVTPRTSKLLGKWTMAALEKKVNTDKTGQLFLFTKTDAGWTKAGNATIGTIDDSQNKLLLPATGISTSVLTDFVFVLSDTGQAPTVDQVTGTVVNSETQQAVSGVFVAMDGVDTEAVTDADGKFTLDVKLESLKALNLPAIYLYTWKDGYYCAYQQISTSGEMALTNLTIPIEKFATMTQVLGSVKDNNGAAIPYAKVTLKTPSVLSEIQIEGPKIITGKADESTFKWQVLDPADWVTAIKTIQAKGKNTLSQTDIESLITPQTTDAYFPITLEVTHNGANGATFVEKANGSIYVYTYASGIDNVQEFWFDLVPDYSNFSFLDAWTDNNGDYIFYGIEEKLIPFLTANAESYGFTTSPFTPLPAAGQNGDYTQDFILTAKPPAQELLWNFDTGAQGWTASLTSQGQAVNSTIGWQAVSNPETKPLSTKLKDSVYLQSSDWVDTTGTIVGPITLDQTQSDDIYYGVASAQLSFQEDGQTKTIPVLLYDNYNWTTDTPRDGIYDWLGLDYNQSTGNYYPWYDTELNPNASPAPYESYYLQEGSLVMLSYQGAPAATTLLPAYSGTTAFWVGNQAEGDDAGTYYDSTLPVSTSNPVTVYDATLESPLIELTNFNQATLQFSSWFEVNADINTYSSLTVEVAVMDPDLPDGTEVTLETAWSTTIVKKGEYQKLVQYNPYSQSYGGVAGFLAKPSLAKAKRSAPRSRMTKAAAPSSALRKTASVAPKPVLLLDSIFPNDIDGDGMSDVWESQWTCSADGHLDPLADSDYDAYLNIEEYYDNTDPCDDLSAPVDANGNLLVDSWEAAQTCPLTGTDIGDTDSDGFSDFDEFLLQSNPCDSSMPTDYDADLMPDIWESQWSCSMAGNLDPDGDPDSDGTSNYYEYFYMTDPCTGIAVSTPVYFSGWPLTSAGEYNTPDWMPYEINLSPYAGHTIKIRYTFSFANHTNNLYRGWAIDDVRIVDQESYKYFELLNSDFGYYEDYTYNPVATGATWDGTYTLSIANGSSLTMEGVQSAWTPDPQSISVTQTDLSLATTITFENKPCTVEGYFYDQSYSSLSFYFYDTATNGSEVSGWGYANQGMEGFSTTGTIQGYDWVAGGTSFFGDITLE